MISRRLASTLLLAAALLVLVVKAVTAQTSVYLPALPNAQSFVRFPLVTAGDRSCRLPTGPFAQPVTAPLPVAAADELTATVDILPLGTQLDDVGQYYSQVSPSLMSALRIANPTSSAQTFDLTLYGDTGNVARTLQGCRVDPGRTRTVQFVAGELAFGEDDGSLPAAEVCAGLTVGKDGNGKPATSLHGIYHAQITATNPAALDVRVSTRRDPALMAATAFGVGEYRATAGANAASAVPLPGLLASRDRSNWWDTEVAVQNVSGVRINLQFRLCTDTGQCFDNNAARLAPYERRIFLASHLLYASTPAGLVEHAGWVSAAALASPVDPTQEGAQLAVAVNYFRQPVGDTEVRPQAENGSDCLLSATPPPAAREFTVPLTQNGPWQVRLANAAGSVNRVRVDLVDAVGNVLSTAAQEIAADTTWNVEKQELEPDPARRGNAPADDRVGDLRLHIVAKEPVTVLGWDADGLLSPRLDAAADGAWYAPLVAAPIVRFRWDSSSGSPTTGRPYKQFGVAETVPTVHASRPDWLRELNWYAAHRTLDIQERWCNETVSPYDPYSTHIPLWGGLRQCDPTWSGDRKCVNSLARFQRVRNNLPSACAGRPLFLANEPDLGPMGYMTYHELGRLVYVMRDWPGQLFSPVFASYNYEAPVYPPEVTDFCRQALAESLCPQTPGCERCRQDGIVDGRIDPYDISFKGLEEYYATPNLWAQGQSWRFEDTVEGMLIHFYQRSEDVLDDNHWRVYYLHLYRDRAAAAGWPIIVKEYGFPVSNNEFGIPPSTTVVDIADRVDNHRRFLQQHLGNGEAAYNNNPFKLFWYQTGCDGQGSLYGKLCLFSAPQQLTDPVGVCWREDAARNDPADWSCGQVRESGGNQPALTFPGAP